MKSKLILLTILLLFTYKGFAQNTSNTGFVSSASATIKAEAEVQGKVKSPGNIKKEINSKAKSSKSKTDSGMNYFYFFGAFILYGVIWHFFLRRRCPECRSTEFREEDREILDKYSETRSRTVRGTRNNRRFKKIYEWEVRITVYDVTFNCLACDKLWIEEVKEEIPGSEHCIYDDS